MKKLFHLTMTKRDKLESLISYNVGGECRQLQQFWIKYFIYYHDSEISRISISLVLVCKQSMINHCICLHMNQQKSVWLFLQEHKVLCPYNPFVKHLADFLWQGEGSIEWTFLLPVFSIRQVWAYFYGAWGNDVMGNFGQTCGQNILGAHFSWT